MVDRFWHHLEQAARMRHEEGIKGDYYLNPDTNEIKFILSTPPKRRFSRKEVARALSVGEAAPLPVGEQPGSGPEVEPRIRIDPGNGETEEA